MNLYSTSVPQFIKMLGNLGTWLDAGVVYAEKKKFDPNVLLQARLAPDQYPLVRQVQAACDAAKFAAARLSGKEPPKHPDTEQTMAEVKARIDACVAYLKTFEEKDFAGADRRLVGLPWAPGKGLAGVDYLVELSTPNFYFHVTTAYAILRHNGVDLGKGDFLGQMSMRDL